MKEGKPHDPDVVEPGPHPPNAERHGIWRIALISFFAAVVIMAIIYFVAT